MAKLNEFKNPLATKEGSIFDLSNWIGGVLWVAMTGIIIALGVKALGKIDSFVPGNQTPNIAPYKSEPVTGTQYVVL